MEAHSDWYNRIVKEISLHKDTLSKKDYKKYKLDLLLRIVKRVDGFFSYCGECQTFQQEITNTATISNPKSKSNSIKIFPNPITNIFIIDYYDTCYELEIIKLGIEAKEKELAKF